MSIGTSNISLSGIATELVIGTNPDGTLEVYDEGADNGSFHNRYMGAKGPGGAGLNVLDSFANKIYNATVGSNLNQSLGNWSSYDHNKGYQVDLVIDNSNGNTDFDTVEKWVYFSGGSELVETLGCISGGVQVLDSTAVSSAYTYGDYDVRLAMSATTYGALSFMTINSYSDTDGVGLGTTRVTNFSSWDFYFSGALSVTQIVTTTLFNTDIRWNKRTSATMVLV